MEMKEREVSRMPGQQENLHTRNDNMRMNQLRRRSSLCSRAVVESIRVGRVHVLKEALAMLGKKAKIDELDEFGCALLHHSAKSDSTEAVRILVEYGANIEIRDLEDELTPLHVAARFNCRLTLELLLELGADPSLVDSHLNTALHHAVRRRHIDIVNILLTKTSGDINSANRSGMTALHLACTHGDVNICQLLLDYGADIRAQSADGMTPLHSSVFSSSTEATEKVLSKALALGYDVAEFVNDPDLDKSTALHLAAETGNIKSVEICLSHGAGVNYRRANDTTPLHIAAMKGDVLIAELLFSEGADIEAKDYDFMSALHRASALNKVEMITFLLSKGADLDGVALKNRTPFLVAVAMGKTESASHLIQAGADVSALDSSMKNCMHLAVESENLEMIQMLVGNENIRENLFKPDADERVALHYAAMGKDIKILEILLTKYTRVAYQDEHHKTPLHYAAESGRATHVEALGRIASKVNERDDHGMTPLHHAAMRKHKKVCLVLEQLGADVDCKDNNRWTPLMLSSKSGCYKTSEGLLDRQASMDHVNSDDNTALHIASRYGHLSVVNTLLDRGAPLMVLNKLGQTFLSVALKSGASDVALAVAKHKRWKEIMEHKNTDGHTPIKDLIEHCPDAAHVIMDRCIQSCHLATDPEYTVTYDFHLLDPGPDDEASLKGNRFFGPTTMVAYGRQSLLLHPLTTKLLEVKWHHFGRKVYYFNLVTYLAFLVSYSVFMISERAAQNFQGKNKTSGTKTKASDLFQRKTQLDSAVLFIALFFALGHILKEFLQMFMQGRRYLRDLSNLTDWALYICTFMFTLPYLLTNDDLDETLGAMKDPRNIWLFGVVSIFLCYLNLLLLLRRFQSFGIHVSMFFEVTKTIAKFMVIFSVFILAFAIVFHILLKEQAPFDDFGLAIAKVSVMLVGEFEFVSTFVDTQYTLDEEGNSLNVFPEAAVVFLNIFILFMAIALMNLLIGLAVGDIKSVQRNATLRRLAMQVEFNAEIQKKYPHFITRMVYKPQLVIRPNFLKNKLQKVHQWLFGIECHSFDSTSLVGHQDSTEVAYSEVRQQLSKTKRRVKSLVFVVQAQNRLLRSLTRKLNHPTADADYLSVDDWPTDDNIRLEMVDERGEEGEEGKVRFNSTTL